VLDDGHLPKLTVPGVTQIEQDAQAALSLCPPYGHPKCLELRCCSEYPEWLAVLQRRE